MDQKREIVLATFVKLGVALFVGTEALSLLGALSRPWVALFWVVALALIVWRTRIEIRRPNIDWFVAFCCTAVAAIVITTGVTAWFSPPNSSDAMAYHMPRVIYWAEQGSVRFFPTQYLNQIMLQPLAEYAMLHLYLLAGSDQWINFVQWTAALGSIVGVSAVAKELGATARGQAMAALFAATLPSGILAASGAKNEWVLALWMICAVYFALRKNAVMLGLAIGLALLTKATAYLFLLPLLALLLRERPRRILLAASLALAINLPHFARNYDLSGSPLGFDSAHGDGKFRWQNDSFGWKQTVSNGLRHLSEQLGARSDLWNNRVFETVKSAHGVLGIDPNDPNTTFPDSKYSIPRNANHEADVPNRWHLLALVALFAFLVRKTPRYVVGIVAGFIAFCFYLKWQQFMARMFLPLYVSAAPLAGMLRPLWLQVALALLLLGGARLPALQNWVRPLQGPKSVLRMSRHDQYFSDLQAWKNQAAYEKAAALVAASGCKSVGIDITNLQIEYPLIALVREKAPQTVFFHTGVDNESIHYGPFATPCIVVCLDCLNDTRRAGEYSRYGETTPLDRFVVFRYPAGYL